MLSVCVMWSVCGECLCVCVCGMWCVEVWRGVWCGVYVHVWCGVYVRVCVQSVSVIKNRQVFPWDPLQSTPGDRLHTQVFPGTAHHRGQTTQRGLPLAPLLGYQGVCGV